MDNRRAFQRFNLRLTAAIFRFESTVPVNAETRNIGRDGFFCVTDEIFSLGEKIHFLISLPDLMNGGTSSCAIKGEAFVVHTVSDESKFFFGIGCRILQFRMIVRSEIKKHAPYWGIASRVNGTHEHNSTD